MLQRERGVSMTRFGRGRRARASGVLLLRRLDGHPDQPNVALALQELHDACAFFKLLGTYPVDSH
jgi:chorismate mutase/prephenate dehydratase